MNQNSSKSSHHPILGSFEPIEDLLYHDCPYVFTFRDARDRLAIAYLIEMKNGQSRYLAALLSETKLQALKSRTMNLRAAFVGQIWEVKLDESANIVAVVEKASNEIGPNELPLPDLTL